MSNKSFEDYPKGQIAIQGGELQDAYDISLAFEDGEQTVHTLRANGMAVGSTGGKRKCDVTFKSSISRAGFERDYLGNWHKRKVIQGRVKVPGKVVVVTGRFTKPQLTSNSDNFVEFTITLSGKYSFA